MLNEYFCSTYDYPQFYHIRHKGTHKVMRKRDTSHTEFMCSFVPYVVDKFAPGFVFNQSRKR
ncbi:MAG: hypothetical protein JWP12_838 [Bacteroidetes bacterium]|nr:hypothetical protein [Bacteroidota bacterium]